MTFFTWVASVITKHGETYTLKMSMDLWTGRGYPGLWRRK